MSRDALIVGINRYQYLSSLKAPAKDAEAIAHRLEQDGDFNKVQRMPEQIDPANGNRSTVSSTQQVLQVQLEQALKQLFRPDSTQAPETALFYFSGHGIPDKDGFDKGYLAASDTNSNTPRAGLSLRWLQWLLSESPVKQQIIWLDCCHSGSLIVNVGAANPGNSESRDRCFIASSRDFETSWEDLNSHYSVLTKALLEGLEPSRLPGRWIDTFALVDYVNQALKGELQTPVCTNFGEAINLTRAWQVEDQATKQIPVDSGICPYKGLEFFDCNDQDPKYFYGREALTDQLLDQVRKYNFVAIVGASGCGKSSVLRAGLLHQLKLGQRISGSGQWDIHILFPGQHPLQNLAQTFVDPALPPPERAEQLGKAEEVIAQGSAGIRRLVQTSDRQRVMVVVDQFEEVFTLCQDVSERQRFFQCLLDSLPLTEKLCLIITMRADFLNKCLEQEYSGLAKQIEQHLVTIPSMSHKELRQAIIKPAERVGLKIQPELVDKMVQELEGAPGSLPLLQYTLTELWKRRLDNCLRLTTYSRIGGVGGTLGQRATEVYNQFLTGQRATVQHVFLSLTHLGEEAEDTRRRMFQADLVTPLHTAAEVEVVVKKLADEKLVVTNNATAEDITTEEAVVVDIAHEALIRQWPLLRHWLAEKRDLLRQSQKLAMAAQEWRTHGKQASDLLRGRQLLDARKFQNKYRTDAPLSALAEEFIARSIQKQSNNQFALGIAVIILAIMAIIILYPYLLHQILRRRVILSEEMVSFPPGEAVIGTDDPKANQEEKPEWKVFMPAFYIDKFEVSNRQYRLCETAGACSAPLLFPDRIKDSNMLNYPVVGVTAYQAYDYCQWIGRRLPTELEWERAARGIDGRQWPWGNEPPTLEHANIRFIDRRILRPVDSFEKGVSKEGVFNLVGNAWEWTASYYQDSYSPPYNQHLTWDGNSSNKEGDSQIKAIVLRGGSGMTDIKRVTVRISSSLGHADEFTGIRCADD
ncbi:SUMF1/EgtB/PvdO family nonheme iron enzyme [Leptothoe sp. EHU-05/26/07-4]